MVRNDGVELRASAEITVAIEALMDSMSEGVVIYALDGSLVAMNRAALRMHGYEDVEEARRAADRLPERLRLTTLAGQPVPEERWPVSLLLGGRPFQDYEVKVERLGGARTWVGSFSGSIVRDEQGTPVHAVMTVHDITAHAHCEEELRHQADDLRDANRRKDRFLALLAHELRNPLAPIRNAADVLRRNLEGLPPERLAWGLEVISRQAHQMQRIVDDLLDVARISHGRFRMRVDTLQLAPLVEEALAVTRTATEARSQLVVFDACEEALFVRGDAARLQQVIVNLIDNASKYGDSGGQIHLTLAREGDEAVLRVRDDGVGIAPDDLAHVFDSFWQAEGALERARGGLGLGLQLVQRIIELHGGRVIAYSEGLGRGSEFEVRLPQVRRRLAQGTSVDDVPHRNGHRLKVLVVDDNEDAADALCLALGQMDGIDTRTAACGADALTVCHSFRPDLVLVDLWLPDIDGCELFGRLREVDPSITGFAVTGLGDGATRVRTAEHGFRRHLVKPVDLEVLEREIVELIETT